MSRRSLFLLAVCALIGPIRSEAQFTSSTGNIDIYARKTGSTKFGLLNTTIIIPPGPENPATELHQKGILFTSQYSLGSFDPIVLGMGDQIQVAFEGNIRIGGGFGSETFEEPWGSYTENTLKYYTVVLDILSMDLAAGYTHMFRSGTGISLRGALTIVNIGATAAMLEKGTFKEHGILVANILPVQLTGSLFFDFGRSGIGVSFFYNPGNILTYSITPEELYTDEYRGVVSKTTIKKSSWQICYVF
jgi:hypothetical protein